ncbi:terpenoid synthase [Aspergillus heteromorphus CBS 117.55]|uniref:Terpenoid synthase n=1 Tax=Aspergillus heteromorphus CBS 117.55 TaxID=1448321 RepID=A0A317WX60_9EURO|nr:terpenoid synthase [Aspergillus heteromorphus CBS 117.55]PWY89787.1 terpenoid synthase [Aspergillus heteromorphus CBS 117.55]
MESSRMDHSAQPMPDEGFDRSRNRRESNDNRETPESPSEIYPSKSQESPPLRYLLEQSGKDFRGTLIRAFNEWLQIPTRKVEIITRIVELLHTSSLLIDDIEDSSELRRGLPVAHSSIYGHANLKAHLDASHIFNEEPLDLHIGQGLDLYWRENLVCPDEEDYLEMIRQKTGGLLRLAVRLMLLETNKPDDFITLADSVGIAFQIGDDYRNLRNPKSFVAKGPCEDLTEGKFSLPVIHSLRSNPEDTRILAILRQRTKDEAVKQYAIAYMESTGSFEYCERLLVQGLGPKEGRDGFDHVFAMLALR